MNSFPLPFRFLHLLAALLIVHGRALAASPSDVDATDSSMRFAAVLMSMRTCCPDESWPEAELKVVSELAVNGIQVDRIEGEAGTEQTRRLSLIQSANRYNAIFSVMILKAPLSLGGGINIWINDRMADRIIVRHLIVANEDDPDSATLVGLKTVEAIQSSLLEIRRLSTEQKTEKIPDDTNAAKKSSAEEEETVRRYQEHKRPPPVPRITAPSWGHRLGLGMGGGVMWSPGKLGVLTEAGLSLDWTVLTLLSLELDTALASLVSGISARNSVATFQTFPIRAWCLYTPLSNYKIRPVLGLGGGIVLVQSKGNGSFPYEGKTVRTVVGVVGGTGHLLYAMSQHFWLRTGVRLSALIPEIEVSFSGYPIGAFGKLVVEGFFHLEVRF